MTATRMPRVATAAVAPRRKTSRAVIRRRLRALVILLVGLVLAAPLLYLLAASLMNDAQLTRYPPSVFPSQLHFGNYSAAFDYLKARSIINSLIFTVGVVAVQWMLCVSGGLVVAKMRFRTRNLLTGAFGISLFVPAISTLIPTFVVADKLHLINTYPGLILPIAAQTGFGTLIFRQFIVNLPDALIEAARLDGAGWWIILRRIIIPLCRPASGAYIAISTLTAWNMYVWPLVATTNGSLAVLTLALAPLASSQYSTVPQTVGMAAAVITTVPMLIAFIVAQRAFVRGLAGTGLE
jgi:ABC-type glycerol-3-phosphate transport system permease component